MKEQERMLAGALYFAGDEELTAARRRAKMLTRNIPAGVVAAGNPCRVLRTIGEEDRVRWQTAERDYDGVPEPR